MLRDRMLPVAGFVVYLASCGGRPAPPSLHAAAASYQGLTTCGGPVSPAAPSPRPRAPELEPMPWSPATTATAEPPAPSDPEPSTDLLHARFRNTTTFETCAQRHAARRPEDATLRVETRFEVRADGRVAGAEVRGADAELDRCLCDAITAIDFRGIGGRAIVSYPLIVTP